MALVRSVISSLGHSRPASSLLQLTGRMLYNPCAHVSHSVDGKGGYRKHDNRKTSELVREGFKHFRGEVNLFKSEMEEKFRCDAAIPICHGDYEIPWNFRGTDMFEEWIVTADQDHNEGFSSAHFTKSKNNNALFYGNLSTKVPKDGIVVRSGYCNIRSPRNTKSFKRFIPYDWTDFTHLVICCRGDGRTYALNLNIDTYFDINQYDQYNYFLYTHGGPYWQTAKIPFSKFFLSSQGRVQDKQAPLPQDRITHVGITMADAIDGRFQLELGYIGVMYDASHEEQFAYEMYQCDPAHVAHW